MKIVFLDFDGVLNNHDYLYGLGDNPLATGSDDQIDPKAVAKLNRIYRETGAVVVVSSTWRLTRTVPELRQLLRSKGLRLEVIGKTPAHIGRGPVVFADRRGEEIHWWLTNAEEYGVEVESFVILDDDSDMQPYMDRLVKTTFQTGLLEEHVDRAIALLKTPMPLVVFPSRALL